MPTKAHAHLFEPEKERAVGAGRDYQGEMLQLEAQADALKAEAERIDLPKALRECNGAVARRTEAASSCAASNQEKALTKIHMQQERFRAEWAEELEQEVEASARTEAVPNKYAQVGSAPEKGQPSSERMAALRARATARAEAL